ncbi:MAG: ATP-binding protein [Planctomycetota bacterium]
MKRKKSSKNMPVLFKVIPPSEYQIFIENLVENMDLGICITNQIGEVCLWNSQMTTLFCSKAIALEHFLIDLLERFNFRLLSSNSEVDWSQVINRILEKGEMVSFSRITLNQTPDRAVLLDIQAYPLIDSANSTLGAAFIFSDVTKAVILEQQMLQTEKVQSVAELGANLAHEIRNPLNAISLNAQLLREEIANGNQSTAFEVIDLILHEIRRLDHLISDFLEFARPKQPRMLLDSILEPLNKSISLYRQPMLKKNIQLKKNWKAVDLVYHDPEQLQQVFNNILENAIQWTPENGTITIEVKEQEGYVVITFIDSGPGIAPQILDRIFDVFYSKREGGIGVGLAIVRSLLKAHHGKVSAKNHKKGGAQFNIYLPLRTTALGLGIIPLSTTEKNNTSPMETP